MALETVGGCNGNVNGDANVNGNSNSNGRCLLAGWPLGETVACWWPIGFRAAIVQCHHLGLAEFGTRLLVGSKVCAILLL